MLHENWVLTPTAMSSECFFGKGDKTWGDMNAIALSILNKKAPPIFDTFHHQVSTALVY